MTGEQKMFVVAIDVLAPTFDPDAIRIVLKNSQVITGWWHHIPGCFLITSTADANRLTDEIRTATGNARLLVMEVGSPAHRKAGSVPIEKLGMAPAQRR